MTMMAFDASHDGDACPTRMKKTERTGKKKSPGEGLGFGTRRWLSWTKKGGACQYCSKVRRGESMQSMRRVAMWRAHEGQTRMPPCCEKRKAPENAHEGFQTASSAGGRVPT